MTLICSQTLRLPGEVVVFLEACGKGSMLKLDVKRVTVTVQGFTP